VLRNFNIDNTYISYSKRNKMLFCDKQFKNKTNINLNITSYFNTRLVRC